LKWLIKNNQDQAASEKKTQIKRMFKLFKKPMLSNHPIALNRWIKSISVPLVHYDNSRTPVVNVTNFLPVKSWYLFPLCLISSLQHVILFIHLAFNKK